jgi:nucleoside-diphosphate-sugar epimerase
MKVLITGANGFISSFLVEQLLKKQYQVRCFILDGEPLKWQRDLPVEIFRGNICHLDTLYGAVQGMDYVYHLAGVKTEWDEASYFRINVEGTKNLLRATLQKNRNLKRFVYISSQAAAGPSPDGHAITEEEACHPLTYYGKSKRAAEEYLQTHSDEIPITILRPSLVYGPRNRETEFLFEITKWGLIPHIRHHNQYLNLIYVRDLVEAIILAAEHERASGQIYFITSREQYTWREIADWTFRIRNKKGWIIPIPRAGVRLAAGSVKFYRTLRGQTSNLIDDKMNELLEKHWVCSGQKAKLELGFEPMISLEEGIEETVKWYDGRKE